MQYFIYIKNIRSRFRDQRKQGRCFKFIFLVTIWLRWLLQASSSARSVGLSWTEISSVSQHNFSNSVLECSFVIPIDNVINFRPFRGQFAIIHIHFVRVIGGYTPPVDRLQVEKHLLTDDEYVKYTDDRCFVVVGFVQIHSVQKNAFKAHHKVMQNEVTIVVYNFLSSSFLTHALAGLNDGAIDLHFY